MQIRASGVGFRQLRLRNVPTNYPAGISLAVPPSGENTARPAIPFPIR